MSVLPDGYYHFFSKLEPSLALIGAALAIFSPEGYADDLFPFGLERGTRGMGGSVRGRILCGGLGNCFFLLAMISMFLFPLFRRELAGNPVLQEKMIWGLLTPLAIADITHIALTLWPLPASIALDVTTWTVTLWGNCGITIVLFIARIMWMIGLFRARAGGLTAAGSRKMR